MIKKIFKLALCCTIVATVSGCKSKQKLALEELNSAIGGEWIIQSVGNTVYNDDTSWPTLFFFPSEKRYSAFDGCNRQQGEYKFDEKTGNLLFNAGLSTMMMCPNPLKTGVSPDVPITIEQKVIDGEDYLYLTNTSTKEKSVLHRLTLNVLAGKWQIAEVNGEKFDNPELTMTFDPAEKRFTGTTDCNSFSGEMVSKPERPMSMIPFNVAVSMRLCPDMSTQQKILEALSKVNEVDYKKSNLVYLKGANNVAIKLTKLPPAR